MIENKQYKEALIFAGSEEYSVLIDTLTDRVVKAFVRGKWISTKYYTIWQEYYEAQKSLSEELINTRKRKVFKI